MTMISKKNQKKSLLSLAIASFALLAVGALADDGKQVVEETIVTITRIDQSLDDVIGSVSEFDAADIQRIQPYDLNDMFDLEPGLEVLRTGSRGSTTSVQVRGSNSGQSLILVNGMRISSATLGTSQYALVPPELIGKVEILRGGASALYGSDAIGGVVNIHTMADQRASPGVRVGVDYGSHNYHRAAVGGNLSGESLDGAIAIIREQSDGIDSIKHDLPNFNIADDDGYERLGGALSLSYKPDPDSKISWLSLTNHGESEFDKLPNQWSPNNGELLPYTDQALTVHNLAVSRKVDDVYSTEISVGYSADESEEKEKSPASNDSPSLFKTINKNVSWLNDLGFSGQTLVLGVERHIAEVEGTTEYDQHRRKTDAVFAQLVGGVGPVSYALGLREDSIERVGRPTTPSAAVAVDFLNIHNVYVRYAEGFKAPTFNDLYFPWSGNPELKPEESNSAEVGYKLTSNIVSFQVGAFEKNVENLIEWVPDDIGNWSPMNIGEARLRGAELNLGLNAGLLGRFDFIVDYLEAVDVTNPEVEQDIDYRAKRSLKFSWQKSFSDYEFGLQGKLQSERKVPEQYAEDGFSPGYGVVNATFSYQLNKYLRAQAKLNNIFDKEYSLNPSYNEDGRNWMVGVKASF